MEHTDFSFETVGMLSMLAREAGLIPIVRPPGTLKPHDLTRPLDSGAQGCSYLPLKRRDSSPTCQEQPSTTRLAIGQ